VTSTDQYGSTIENASNDTLLRIARAALKFTGAQKAYARGLLCMAESDAFGADKVVPLALARDKAFADLTESLKWVTLR
jgi:hypothetical protein